MVSIVRGVVPEVNPAMPCTDQKRPFVPAEARLGQRSGRVRIWAKTGSRPRLPAGQRHENANLFGAIRPRSGKGAALMPPKANTQAMQMHLEEISRKVAARAHAVFLMDRAGLGTPPTS